MRVINGPLTGVISVSGYGYRNFTGRDLLPRKRFSRAALGLAKGEAFRRRHNIPPDPLVVTQVSWLIPEKGVDDLLIAVRDVVAAEPKAHFLLAGDGSYRPHLEQAARDLCIESHVTFAGVVPDPLAAGRRRRCESRPSRLAIPEDRPNTRPLSSSPNSGNRREGPIKDSRYSAIYAAVLHRAPTPLPTGACTE
jgi:glycosyltransferase involved in cell wall biosynthesis